MKKRIISKDECSSFNSLRMESQGKTFDNKTIVSAMKQLFQSNDSNLLANLCSVGAIERISRGKYKFPETPVHISRLQAAFTKKANRKPKLNALTVESATEFLKKHGYRVLQKKLNVEDAMMHPQHKVEEFFYFEDI